MLRFLIAASILVLSALPAAAWPPGWREIETVTVPDNQLEAFSQKLGGRITRLTNTILEVDGKRIRVNTIACATPPDAARVGQHLPGTYVDKTTVTELVTDDRRLRSTAPYDLGLRPRKVVYHLRFTAAPINDCDYMAWNEMFNDWLRNDEAAVHKLAPRFRFGSAIPFRSLGQGPARSLYNVRPTAKIEGSHYQFAFLPVRFGIPQVEVEASVTSDAFTATPGTAAAADRSPTRFWPSDHEPIKRLAATITGDATSERVKIDALLAWFADRRNVRYGGPVRGSRQGVERFLQTRLGECWDYSDAFITLARALGIPCRQVVGWLVDGSKAEGHVWVEVWRDNGWIGVDPTGGIECGATYVPLFTSSIGDLPIVYTSPVMITH